MSARPALSTVISTRQMVAIMNKAKLRKGTFTFVSSSLSVGSNQSHSGLLSLCMISVRVLAHILEIKPFLLKASNCKNKCINFICCVANWSGETCSMEGHYCQSDIVFQKQRSHLTNNRKGFRCDN